jgi:hypothetical protein
MGIFDIQGDSHNFSTLTKFRWSQQYVFHSYLNMNHFKLLYGSDIPHESLNYKNLKMAVIDSIFFI